MCYNNLTNQNPYVHQNFFFFCRFENGVTRRDSRREKMPSADHSRSTCPHGDNGGSLGCPRPFPSERLSVRLPQTYSPSFPYIPFYFGTPMDHDTLQKFACKKCSLAAFCVSGNTKRKSKRRERRTCLAVSGDSGSWGNCHCSLGPSVCPSGNKTNTVV